MKNILVATDFSNNAYCALFYATKLLASQTCTFYILNTYSELSLSTVKTLPVLGIKKYLKQLELESEEKVTHTKHKIVLDNENPLHTFKTISQKGDLVDIIEQKVEELQIDLITMGNKGLNRDSRYIFWEQYHKSRQ